MSSNFKISVDLSQVAAIRDIINAAILPRLSQAVSAVAQQAAIDWKESVKNARLWSGEKQAYDKSITWKMTPEINAFSAVVESDYKFAYEIDNGRPAKDLKKMLNTSMKVRNGKNGRYLIIPFRHNTPGNGATGQTMPSDVHSMASQLAPSRITGTGQRLSGTGAFNAKTRQAITVAQNKYSWGGQLVASALGSKKKQSRYAGMYRFDTTSPSGAKSSTFLTFRVMTEHSKGWIIPPRAGLHLVQGVVTRLQPLANIAFSEAMKRDLGG